MVLILLLLGIASQVSAQSYTIAPPPFQTAFDNTGRVVNNGCIWTYVAGTTTPAVTFADNIGTPNLDPIRSDSAGRFTAYLLAGSNYKFVYESQCVPPAHGPVLRTADNIAGVPAAAATVDVTGTAGETISAGQCAYLSDGSGSKTAGQWYKCDSATSYSSVSPEVGIAPSAITTATAGTIRLFGSVTGLASLSVGAEYFVGATGAITTTAPANRRHLGHADTASSLVLTGDPAVPVVANGVHNGRLTLSNATPVTITDVTAATTLYYTPYFGNRFDSYDGTTWNQRTFTQLSINIPATTSTLYDVFVVDTNGTLSLELLAWTNDTTRATTITTQDGVHVKNGDATRVYVGSMRTTTVSGQSEDSLTKRYVWNEYNRVRRPLKVIDATDSWTYTTATWRQANAGAGNQVDLVIGIADAPLTLTARHFASNTGGGVLVQTSIGEDSTSAPATGVLGVGNVASLTLQNQGGLIAVLEKYPAVGRHVYAWLERSTASGTTTWYGDNGDGTLLQTGLSGWMEG